MKATRLGVHMTVTSAAGILVVAVSVASTPWSKLAPHWMPLLVLAVVLIGGELRPIPVVRGDEAGDEISISTTVALAMVLLSAPGAGLVAQALALVADEVRERRDWGRLLFNIGQYSLALVAAAAVYAQIAVEPVWASWRLFSPRGLPAALSGAFVFFLVNNALTDIAVALKLGRPVISHVIADIRNHSVVSGVLLGLSPVFAEAISWSAWSLPLLLLPLVAVHQSARLAAARHYEALHDTLTGLPNRSLLTMRLQDACRNAQRKPFAVMLCDLDHFKDINDTLGHHVGDLLLRELAKRLTDTAPARTTVARLGGDEFAILAPAVATTAEAHALGSVFAERLAAPFFINGVRLDVGGSTGIALAPTDGQRADELLRRADVALYRAKEARGRQVHYDAARDEHSVQRLQLLGELRDGLNSGELVPAYQPIVDCRTGGVLGLEILARWQHPRLGLLDPHEFISLAENTGLIDRLTVCMLEQALADLAPWHAAGHEVGLSLNLSARTLTQSQFAADVDALLASARVAPRWLTVEVTETIIVREVQSSAANLSRLRAAGMRVAIDDFGTGYSSLAYLQSLPVDSLKVDRGFVERLGTSGNTRQIVRAITRLGHDLGLTVVAEGVETANALHQVRDLGCDAAQGFHLSRPMPASQVGPWLAAHRARTADEAAQVSALLIEAGGSCS